MSTQSGINTSQELLDAFKSLDRNGSLLIKISSDNTELLPETSFNVPASLLVELLPQIREYLESTHPDPAYIIAPTHDERSEERLFASYIPDSAPIRSKMLYASTKNSILQQLGGSFNKTHILSWTEPEDITIESYYQDVDTSNKPLTSDEQLLQQMNSLHTQEQASFSRKLVSMHGDDSLANSSSSALTLGTQTPVAGSAISFKVDAKSEQELASLDKDLLVFEIDSKSETVLLVDSKLKTSVADLISTLQTSIQGSSKPLYALFKYSAAHYAFIYACPSGSKVKDRMIYATNKRAFFVHIKSIVENLGAVLDKNLEVGDVDELDPSELKEQEEEESNTQKLRFNKPKGPRRR